MLKDASYHAERRRLWLAYEAAGDESRAIGRRLCAAIEAKPVDRPTIESLFAEYHAAGMRWDAARYAYELHLAPEPEQVLQVCDA